MHFVTESKRNRQISEETQGRKMVPHDCSKNAVRLMSSLALQGAGQHCDSRRSGADRADHGGYRRAAGHRVGPHRMRGRGQGHRSLAGQDSLDMALAVTDHLAALPS